MVTLRERKTQYGIVINLPDDHTAATVNQAGSTAGLLGKALSGLRPLAHIGCPTRWPSALGRAANPNQRSAWGDRRSGDGAWPSIPGCRPAQGIALGCSLPARNVSS
jgi:hypothetical protein